jgi:hypothetical protein
MRSELEAHSSQLVAGQVNGKKVYLNTEKEINQSVTEYRNNQDRFEETNSQKSLMAVDGKLKFDPSASHLNTNVASGAIVVDLAANTGLRANFKLDNGSLLFDFNLARMSVTEQVATAEKVAPEQDGLMVNGTQNTQVPSAANEIHFKGVNIKTIPPQNTTDGLRASLIADHSALRFNYSIFILGISLIG